MANINITKTELVWPGKYNEDGSLREVPRVNLPFHVIERVGNSGRKTPMSANEVSTPSSSDRWSNPTWKRTGKSREKRLPTSAGSLNRSPTVCLNRWK